jgi:YHS domain-containing protein
MARFILLTILLIVVARLFWRLVDGVLAGARGDTGAGRRGRAPVKLVRDPVCGTYVPPRAALSVTSAGSTHYFCSEECRKAFGAGRQ